MTNQISVISLFPNITVPTLRTFRRRLTNLSSRNRSLLLSNLPTGQFLDLHETDFLLNKPSFSLIADLIGRKASVTVCEILDARQARSNEVSRKLRRIDRTARFIEEERGTEDLYVGWPFVRGKFADGTVVHGPLLFFPVQLVQQGKFWTLTRRGDAFAFLNPTLALAYGQFNQIRLPDEVVEKTFDDLDKDPLVFRTQLYEWLKTSPLDINYNQNLFADRLHFYDGVNARGLDQLERTGELKLYPEAILGIFPQAGSYLVPDYDVLLSASALHAVSTESLTPDSPSFVATRLSVPENKLFPPLPLDASQEAALRAIRSGESLVVQGPPGTGKSQLIANLMADAAASGKRVLLVCQKRAALDVVHERLTQVGMAPFLALVHDFQDDRRALYNQLANQIDQIDAYRQQNNSLNAVLLQRDFDLESRCIDEAVSELHSFKQALFDTSVCGLSAKELYLSSRPDGPSVPLADIYRQFPFTLVDQFVRRLGDYAAYQQRLGMHHAWAERVSFAAFSAADLTTIDQAIRQWTETRDDANQLTASFLSWPLSLKELVSWQDYDLHLSGLITLLNAPDAEILWRTALHLRANPTHPARTGDETTFARLAEAWDECLTTPGPESSLPTTDLRAFRALLADARTARSAWISWRWWLLTNPGKAQLQAVIAANHLSLSEPDLQTLARMVEQRIRLEATQYEAGPLLAGLSLPHSAASLHLLRRTRKLTERLESVQPLNRLPASAWQTHTRFVEVVQALLALSKRIVEQQTDLRTYLTKQQVERVWQENTSADALRKSLRSDFDLLVEADRLQQGFSAAERTVVDRLREHDPLNWVATFQNALRLTWLNHLEQHYPDLRSVSSLKMGQIELALQHSVQQKQALSRAILLMKLREQTYRNLSFNRLNNVVTYRDLTHQTTKKRNVWPVRKLIESFANEVFKLIPCWLASPETVSAIFPLRADLFDLVIFDEASQCFAEQGIPAMARGKQVVITGDSQQLRPSDLYRTRLDDAEPSDDTPAALEAESLLDLAAQALAHVSLTEHYRSRSLDLISFSNRQFYQNKLQLLPDFDDLNRPEPSIQYLNVGGTWHQNTNLTEAEAILQLLNRIDVELPGRSVGIVTFNYPQQQLIQDKLESDGNERRHLSLFVKNIENVQGDERDVIIFSIGYGPDERGRLSMQFGSLNTQGGENRLNVAVTRARERVYVVTSVWPEQLLVDDAANQGPKLLKAYLHYARDVSEGRFRPLPTLGSGLPSGSLLKDQLAAQHPDWRPELPFADLAIRVDDTYQSLILTDDDAYYHQTLKQAHAYLPIALRSRQWPFKRIWSREFWRNPLTE